MIYEPMLFKGLLSTKKRGKQKKEMVQNQDDGMNREWMIFFSFVLFFCLLIDFFGLTLHPNLEV